MAEDSFDERPTKGFPHPIAVGVHLLFRIMALVAYLLCSWFSFGFVLNFIVVVLFLCCDFWTTKNVTGRLLVGLRWWNEVTDDGSSKWVFESKQDISNISATESRTFWSSLYLGCVVWLILCITALVSLKVHWLLVASVGLALNFANAIGYTKCQRDMKSKLKGMAGNFITSQFFRGALNSVVGGDGDSNAR